LKTIPSIALIALLAGCSGGASSVPSNPTTNLAQTGGARAIRSTGGPGTTTVTYYDTYAPVAPCTNHKLTLTVDGSYPATELSFSAGNGPPIIVSNCNFQTPQYVRVTLGEPAYGAPYVRQTDYTVTVDAPAAAKVKATWTALGPTLPGDPGLKGTIEYTISDPAPGGGL
jgi:hypothetical protein